ncbi:MAG: TetR family transcriptional regulator [Salinisphaeraceae bacterium]|nr:TetR family transcriptional regulator [Salinisphaeraceae bacterium]
MPERTADSESAELARFRRAHGLTLAAACREIFRSQSHAIQVRNETIAVENLGRIISATLALSNRQGFASMSLRQLAARAGLSLGGLYAYISSKTGLVEMIQAQGRRQMLRVMQDALQEPVAASDRLAAAIRAHLLLSEAMRPWFHFLYMEARLLPTGPRQAAIRSELESEDLFAGLIADGVEAGDFRAVNPRTTASLLKPLLQDWYLKHRKHSDRGLTAGRYADSVTDLMLHYLQAPDTGD